jgi:hypothetical protein
MTASLETRVMTCALGLVALLSCNERAITGSSDQDAGATINGSDAGPAESHCPLPATITADNFADAMGTASICDQAGCAPFIDGGFAALKASPMVAQLTAQYAAALANGTLSVDFTLAGPCVAALADGCSPEAGNIPFACVGVVTPKQSIRQVCYTNDDCILGARDLPWEEDFSAIGACPGTCNNSCGCGVWQPGAGLGEACGEGCSPGLVCSEDDVCAPPQAAGDECSAYYQCAAGLYCYNDGGQPGTCTETIELGQPCPIDSLYAFYSCGFGAYCNQLDAGPACVAYGSIGDPCPEPHGQVDIPFNACQVGLACIDSLCAPEPQSGPCPTVGHCASQSFCDARLNCEPLREDGESCAQEANGCKSGLCGDAGTCVTAGSYCPN